MGERDDLAESLTKARFFLRNTLRELSDNQASQRTTASELTLGGLIKHVAMVEGRWCRFIVDGPSAMGSNMEPGQLALFLASFRMADGDTIASLFAAYDEVARRTDEVLASVDLDATQPLPKAPWYPPDGRWTARRVFLHLIAEIAQHAGHADIIRESLDGAKSMGG